MILGDLRDGLSELLFDLQQFLFLHYCALNLAVSEVVKEFLIVDQLWENIHEWFCVLFRCLVHEVQNHFNRSVVLAIHCMVKSGLTATFHFTIVFLFLLAFLIVIIFVIIDILKLFQQIWVNFFQFCQHMFQLEVISSDHVTFVKWSLFVDQIVIRSRIQNFILIADLLIILQVLLDHERHKTVGKGDVFVENQEVMSRSVEFVASRQTYVFEGLVLDFTRLEFVDWETGIDRVLFRQNDFTVLNDDGYAVLIPDDFEFIFDVINVFLFVLADIPGHDGCEFFGLADDNCNDV